MFVVMKKLLLLINLSILVLSTAFTMPKNSKGACFSSLPLELQASCLQLTSTEEKVALMEHACRCLLLDCEDIRKQIWDLRLDFTSVSKAPKLTIPDISNDLEIIQANTDKAAWSNNIIKYVDTLKLEKLRPIIFRTLDELDFTLNEVMEKLETCGAAGIETSTNVSIDKLKDLQKQILGIKSLSLLFPYETIDLSYVGLHNREYSVPIIQALPVTIRKIDLNLTHIDTPGLLELSSLIRLEEVSLRQVELTNPDAWFSVIRNLPVTMKRIDLSYTNIDISGLCELSRLPNLEEIGLSGISLPNLADWVSVMQSLPVAVKKIDLSEISLYDTNIDASVFRELSRFTHLEEIKLWYIYFPNRDDWFSVIRNLPVTMKRIDLLDTNIDTSGLLELSRFNFLEEIDLSTVCLTNRDLWVSVMQGLPGTVKSIIGLEHTNCPDDLVEELRSRGTNCG